MRICNIGLQTLTPCIKKLLLAQRDQKEQIENLLSQLDCWDGPDGEPLIYHGWTLTSKLLFKVTHQCFVFWIFQSWPLYQPSSSKWYCHAEWTEIALQDVLHDAILPYAFSTSSYPLILSIENHCTKEQQDKMAHHFKNILGNLLYIQPVDTSRWTNVKYFLTFWKEHHS